MDWRALIPLVMLGCGGRYSVATNDAGPPPEAGLGQLQTDKVDIVFVIDNSSSMATKQDLLRSGISDFLDRIIFPPCVTEDGKSELPRVNKDCPAGYKDKYIPIHDVHVGVITSSLGGGGSPDTCDPNAANPIPQLKALNFNRHNDDRGHLINRKKPDPSNPPPNGIEDVIAGAYPANFLAWLPSPGVDPPPPVNPYSDRVAFRDDFKDLITGVQEYGCGLEAQLEAFYRFLIQPDPWDRVELDIDQASLVGIDQIVLQQRHDFLRPDSLVAVIVVTDEEDSWSDPMWLKGRGWVTRTNQNGGVIQRGSDQCSAQVDPNDPLDSGPNNASCAWCRFSSDPSCKVDGGLFPPGEDGLNVRYTDDMKRRYGMNPQFPIERYVAGLTSPYVPDRSGEHTLKDGTVKNTYVDRRNCVNPLFAKNLPTNPDGELCNLEISNQRNESLLFFGIIGGVPWQLLTDNPMKGGNFKASLEESDWKRILGKDPATYQLEGIDPHMVESIKPRSGIPCQTSAMDTCDPFHGREYDTSTVDQLRIDLQYACIFDLPQPIDCSKSPGSFSCDCVGTYKGPLCAPNDNDNGSMTLQIRGKAYPTIRELRVAQGLGARAIVGSICPKVTTDVNDKDFGYRPALRALVEHMQVALKAPTKTP